MQMRKVYGGIGLLLATTALFAYAQQTPVAVWQAYADDMARRPGMVRFYTLFDDATQQPDRAGSENVLAYRPYKGAPLATEPGRIADRTAVVLDSDYFETASVLFPSNAFTVTLWVRPLGTGTQTGNGGSANGMLACSGSGYTDGWRLVVYDWKTRLVSSNRTREGRDHALRQRSAERRFLEPPRRHVGRRSHASLHQRHPLRRKPL